MRAVVRLVLVMGAVIAAMLSIHPSKDVVCLTIIAATLYVVSEYVMYRMSEKLT